MRNRNFNHILQQRLNFYQQWANDFVIYFKHCEVSAQVSKTYYDEKPLLGIFMKIYFLPINVLKKFDELRAQHTYNKCLHEIKVIKDLLKQKQEG